MRGFIIRTARLDCAYAWHPAGRVAPWRGYEVVETRGPFLEGSRFHHFGNEIGNELETSGSLLCRRGNGIETRWKRTRSFLVSTL
jgi:hypothetical protein